MKDGRIVGFGKAANGLKADASFLDVHSATPIKPLGFSAEDVATLTAKYPYYQFVEVPAGAIGDSPAFTTSMIYANYFAHADMPEDEAYRLTKALWASLEEAATQTNYDGAKGREYSETVETRELLPLHPGAERFYREVGALPS